MHESASNGVVGDASRGGGVMPSSRVCVSDQLRNLADWLDAHPGFEPSQIDTYRGRVEIYVYTAHQPEDVARVARAAGGRWDKKDVDGLFKLRQEIMPGFFAEICALRENVCERVVTGTREVEVQDPDAPTVTVTEEIVEWRCGPLLGGAA